MKRILPIALTLAFVLALTVPTFASEETGHSSAAEQGEAIQLPEETQQPGEQPDVDEFFDPDASEDPGESERPAPAEEDPVQQPEDPAFPDIPENPDIPAGAPEESTDKQEETEDPGALEPQDGTDIISVLVPDCGQVTINPYRMKIASANGETTDQIIHEPQALANRSAFPVRVSVQATGAIQPGSEARFVSAPPADSSADKEIFMYAEFQPTPDGWEGGYGGWPNQVLVTDWGEGREDVLTLDAWGEGYFRLFGAVAPFPETMWAGGTDAIRVTPTFTFTPVDEDLYAADPVEGEAPSIEPEDPPAEEETPPEGPGDSPMEEETQPEGPEVPPTEEETQPMEPEDPPAAEEVPPANGDSPELNAGVPEQEPDGPEAPAAPGETEPVLEPEKVRQPDEDE